MQNYIVKFGSGNIKEKAIGGNPTIAQVLADPDIRGGLGLSSESGKYDAYVGGVNVGLDRCAPPETVISLQSRQCTKNG